MITKEQLQELQEIYTKDHLERGLFFLARKFFVTHTFERWGEINVQNCLNIIDNKKTYSKVDLVQVSFAVFQNESILEAYLKSLPDAVYKLIGKLLFQEEITDDEASNFLKENVLKHSDHSPELKREFYFFNVKSYRQYVNYTTYQYFHVLSLHPILKSLLVKHFPPPLYYNIIPVDEIPETELRFTAEELVQEELPRLLSYQMQQNIKYNSTGRPVEATLTKMQRVCKTLEFYETDVAEIARMRSMLLAGMLYAYSPLTVSATNIDAIKDLFHNHYLKLRSPVFVLQHLKGWTNVSGSDFDKLAERKLQDVFRLMPANKWVAIENLFEYLNTRSITMKPVSVSAARNYLSYQGMYERGSIRIPEKKDVNYDTYDGMVKRAFISGTVFLYAALGLMEVAYNNVDAAVLGKTYYSGYDGLRYFRLTSLGAYILGITAEYTSANSGKTNKLFFDEESLIITAEGDQDVINLSLANYAERLPNNRFRVTNGYFLKDCKNCKDIQKKVGLFKNTVGNSLPVFWERYLNQLVENATSIREQTHVKVYQLPAHAKELHRLIAQDSSLKKLIFKAENFNILVAHVNVTAFKSRMKDLGYIVE